MTDAPERIWAVHGLGEILSFNTYDNGGTEYIRADLHAALEAENAALREALRPFVDYVHDEYRVSGEYMLVPATLNGGGWFGAEDFRRAFAAFNRSKSDEG